MRLSFSTIAVSALTLIASSTLATAAEVRVLSVGSTQIAARMSVWPLASQTLAPVGTGIIADACSSPAGIEIPPTLLARADEVIE